MVLAHADTCATHLSACIYIPAMHTVLHRLCIIAQAPYEPSSGHPALPLHTLPCTGHHAAPLHHERGSAAAGGLLPAFHPGGWVSVMQPTNRPASQPTDLEACWVAGAAGRACTAAHARTHTHTHTHTHTQKYTHTHLQPQRRS